MKTFPKMIYRDGVKLDDRRVVADEAELANAAADGYLPLDMVAVKGGKPAEAPAPAPAPRARKAKAVEPEAGADLA
jgi:hypothetical protein